MQMIFFTSSEELNEMFRLLYCMKLTVRKVKRINSLMTRNSNIMSEAKLIWKICQVFENSQTQPLTNALPSSSFTTFELQQIASNGSNHSMEELAIFELQTFAKFMDAQTWQLKREGELRILTPYWF